MSDFGRWERLGEGLKEKASIPGSVGGSLLYMKWKEVQGLKMIEGWTKFHSLLPAVICLWGNLKSRRQDMHLDLDLY